MTRLAPFFLLLAAFGITSGCVSNPGAKLKVDSPLVPYKAPPEAIDEPEVEPEEDFPVPVIPGEEPEDDKEAADKKAPAAATEKKAPAKKR